MKICPIVKHFCYSRINILLNAININSQNFAQYFKIVPNWQIFAESGHTAQYLPR